MFSPQLGNFPFATSKIDPDNSKSNNLDSKTMERNNGAGDSNQTQIDKTKLIVNYIPQFATEDDLSQIFSTVGRVESVKIMRDFKTGYSFGFGFVKYANPDDASKAIQALNGYNFRNKRLKVSYSRPPGTDMKDSNLYITNLPKDITEQQIDNMFCEYGEIVQRTVLKDKITGMPRGVAFVRFSKGEEAQAAIASLHGKMLENAMLPLSVRVAEDHGRQKAQYIDMWDPMNYSRDSDDSEEPDPEEVLISAVFSRKQLWDPKVPLIEGTQSKIEALWKEITDRFDGRYTTEFLIKKWGQLRDDYILSKRKLFSFVSKFPDERPPRSTFPYFDQMKFLDKTIDLSDSIECPSHRTDVKPVVGETQTPPAKKIKVAEPNDSIDEFLVLLGEGLRSLPQKNISKLQNKILKLLEEETSSV
ncbi:la-related protein 7 isoform X1 [Diorhabda carinulata]|uniref:la-related protein 7 isoform X1 n=2 Tax=Diorhabda carinulata TaxID=1163345 RepID=UPI0025A10F5A|nr:la-related protein 7 isoform X1 [Diorhabda carinulata]